MAVRISRCHTAVHDETACDANTSTTGLIATRTAKEKDGSIFFNAGKTAFKVSGLPQTKKSFYNFQLILLGCV